MAVPRKKTTPMKRGQRRTGHRKETVTYAYKPAGKKRRVVVSRRATKKDRPRLLNEAEASTWRLQEKVRELERDSERRRRRFEQLQSSTTWKLLNRISSIRTRIAGRED